MDIFNINTWKENGKFELNEVISFTDWLNKPTRLVLALDIETTSLDKVDGKILSIGLMDYRKRKFYTIDTKNQPEYLALKEFVDLLNKLKRKYTEIIVVGYNIFNFDIPFLSKKIEKYNLYNPFKLINNNLHFPENEGRTTQLWKADYPIKLVDVYIMTVREYSRRRDLPTISLKDAAKYWLGIDWKIDTQTAIENKFTKQYYDYLRTDLDATLKLFERLFEPYYYLKLLDKKWNVDIYRFGFSRLYDNLLVEYYGDVFTPDPPKNYGGALNDCIVGFYDTNIIKLDIASLYPTIMLNYHSAWSYKDKDFYVRTALKRAKELRLQFKKEKTPAQLGLKIFINAGYGTLGYKYAKINDYSAAENVVKYGAKILQYMINETNKYANVVHWATDGLFAINQAPNTPRLVQQAMPPHVEIDVEYDIDGRLLIADKKSYVLYNKETSEILEVKGKFRNKERIPLLIYALRRIISAEIPQREYQRILNDIKSLSLPPELFQFKRKVRKNERSLLELGFKEGEEVVYYMGYERTNRNGRRLYTKVFSPDKIDPNYYIDELIKFIPPSLFI